MPFFQLPADPDDRKDQADGPNPPPAIGLSFLHGKDLFHGVQDLFVSFFDGVGGRVAGNRHSFSSSSFSEAHTSTLYTQ